MYICITSHCNIIIYYKIIIICKLIFELTELIIILIITLLQLIIDNMLIEIYNLLYVYVHVYIIVIIVHHCTFIATRVYILL